MSIFVTRRGFLGAALACSSVLPHATGAAVTGNGDEAQLLPRQQERVKLSVAMLDTHWKALEPLVEELGVSADFDLDVTALDYEALYSQISLALTQRASSFDVVFLDDAWIPQFATFLTPMELEPELLDVIAPVAFELARFPDKVEPCAMPWLGETQFFVLRPDWLGTLDLPTPESWDETVDTVARLAAELDAEGELAAFGMRMLTEHELVESFLPILRGYGKSIIDAETNVPQLDTPEALAAMETFLTLAGYSPVESKAAGAPSNEVRFEAGLIATMANFWASELLAARMVEQQEDAGHIGSMLQPAESGAERLAMMGVWLAAIPVGSLDPEAASEFLQWLVSPGLQRALPGVALPPVRIDVLRDEGMIAAYPDLPIIEQMLAQATPRGRSPFYPQLEQLLGSELAKAMNERVTGAVALKNANLAIRQFLVREGVLDA